MTLTLSAYVKARHQLYWKQQCALYELKTGHFCTTVSKEYTLNRYMALDAQFNYKKSFTFMLEILKGYQEVVQKDKTAILSYVDIAY